MTTQVSGYLVDADDGDGDQRVDSDVGRDVDEILRELAGDAAYRPVVGGVVIRDERHAQSRERQVAATPTVPVSFLRPDASPRAAQYAACFYRSLPLCMYSMSLYWMYW